MFKKVGAKKMAVKKPTMYETPIKTERMPEAKKCCPRKVEPIPTEPKKCYPRRKGKVIHGEVTAFNQLYEEFPQEEKEQILNEIEQMERIICFVKRNLKGELSEEDIEGFKKDFLKWKEFIQNTKAYMERLI